MEIARGAYGDEDFVVHFEHEFYLAMIHVVVDHTQLDPRRFVNLLRRLRNARDDLRRCGYVVDCEPPLLGQ